MSDPDAAGDAADGAAGTEPTEPPAGSSGSAVNGGAGGNGTYRYGPRGERETVRRGWGPAARSRTGTPHGTDQPVPPGPAAEPNAAAPTDGDMPSTPVEGTYLPPGHQGPPTPPPPGTGRAYPPWVGFGATGSTSSTGSPGQAGPAGTGPGPYGGGAPPNPRDALGPFARGQGGGQRGGAPWAAAASRSPWLIPALVVGVLLLVALVRAHHISTTDVLIFCVMVPSIILHEVSHGWVALMFGDDTAKRAGRLTLNPIPHIDLVGTIIIPAIMTIGGYGAFGWAKPVPVNVSQLRSPRNQEVLVALAGPATNIVLAGLSAAVFTMVHGVQTVDFSHIDFKVVVFYLGLINLWLACFNLIPIPPLDGSALVERALPARWWPGYLRLRQYAMPAVFVLVLINLNMRTGPITWLFQQVSNGWVHLLVHLA